MSVTPARSNIDDRCPPAARLEIRVRLPAVPACDEPEILLRDGTSEPTRGMQVLNGILDKRSRSVWNRFGGRRRSNRLWLVATALVGLSCIAAIVRFTGAAAPTVELPETDVFADDDFEADPTARPVATRVAPLGSSTEAGALTGGEPPHGSAVHAAVYYTQAAGARTVWLDGTIVPDDSHDH